MNYGLELALFTALHFVKLNILYQTSNTLWFIFVFSGMKLSLRVNLSHRGRKGCRVGFSLSLPNT